MESSSYIVIDVKSQTLTEYLKENDIENVFQDIESLYIEGEMLSAELKKSVSKSLISILETVEIDLEDGVILPITDLDTVDELLQFIKMNADEIDNDAEGIIVINSVNPEDGYAYAQKLFCEGDTCVLSKWPFTDGFTKNYTKIQKFNGQLSDGKIPELKGYPHLIWEIVADNEVLEEVMKRTGVKKAFKRKIKESKHRPVPESTEPNNDLENFIPKTLKELKTIFKAGKQKDCILISGMKNDMETIVIPGEIEGKPIAIGYNAFAKNTMLKKVVITDNALGISDGAFAGCKNLKEVVIGKGIYTIASNAFNNTPWFKKQTGMVIINDLLYRYKGKEKDIVIPDGISVIGEYAFYHNEDLETVEFPDSIVEIGSYSFAHCNKIKEITIPENVKFVGVMAFNDCELLESITVKSRDIQFGRWAFDRTKWDQSIIGWHIINDILVSIDMDFFYDSGLSKTKKLIIPENIRVIANDAFNSDVYNWSNVKEIVLPEGLEIIGECVFRNFTGLDKVSFPASLKVIDKSAFNNCSSLKEVSLPDGLIKIGAIAFANTGIETVSIPSSVTELDDVAFPWGCKIMK